MRVGDVVRVTNDVVVVEDMETSAGQSLAETIGRIGIVTSVDCGNCFVAFQFPNEGWWYDERELNIVTIQEAEHEIVRVFNAGANKVYNEF